MSGITDIRAVEIEDSRGTPTLAITVLTSESEGTFAVPSGASTGSGEAFVLRDADGHMTQAIAHATEDMRAVLLGIDAGDQETIDTKLRELDGTKDKSRLGGNTMIGVSIAAAKASARAKNIELYEHIRTLAKTEARAAPYLYMNYINGGKHAQTPLSFQEHMIVPQTDSVSEALDVARQFETALAALIEEKYGTDAAHSMGDEGGFVIQETDARAPFSLLMDAAEHAGVAEKIQIAIDAAASSFFSDGAYTVGGARMDAAAVHELYVSLSQEFPLISIEDPFNEDALADFAALQSALDIRIVGDDLTVTSAERIIEAGEKGAIRAVIIKPNQIGTLTETLDAVSAAKGRGIDVVVSHRSGETNDDFVADLAYAVGAFGLKAGSLRRPERVIKYERLRAITENT